MANDGTFLDQSLIEGDMMTSPTDILSAVLHRLHELLSAVLLYIVSLGPIPRHVGFVMDGNRRYARAKGLKAVQGHTDGFSSLRRVRAAFIPL